jgi:glycerophosphoryl diester phosphodiesterase
VAPRIEIKADAAGRPYPGIVAKTLAVLDAAGQRGRAWIIGFQADTMAEALAAGGLAGVAWLVELPTLRDIGVEGIVAVAKRHGFPEIGLHESAMRRCCAAARGGTGLGTWGQPAAAIRRMLEIGVTSSLPTIRRSPSGCATAADGEADTRR